MVNYAAGNATLDLSQSGGITDYGCDLFSGAYQNTYHNPVGGGAVQGNNYILIDLGSSQWISNVMFMFRAGTNGYADPCIGLNIWVSNNVNEWGKLVVFDVDTALSYPYSNHLGTHYTTEWPIDFASYGNHGNIPGFLDIYTKDGLSYDFTPIQGQYLRIQVQPTGGPWYATQILVHGDTNIPEPATMTLLALGGLALLRRRT